MDQMLKALLVLALFSLVKRLGIWYLMNFGDANIEILSILGLEGYLDFTFDNSFEYTISLILSLFLHTNGIEDSLGGFELLTQLTDSQSFALKKNFFFFSF